MPDKKGMYIVEAAIVMPVFIASMILLISLLPIVTACGKAAFSASDEMRMDIATAAFIDNEVALPVLVKARVLSENKGVDSVRITRYRRKYEKAGIDDLITLRMKVRFRESVSILRAGYDFSFRVTGRAFTGTTHKVGGDGKIVYIFPESGEKYHRKGCRYLTSHCHVTYLSEELMKDYHPCPLCSAESLAIGSRVACFERYGDAYHRPSCRSVDKEKYYIETTRGSAGSSGYSACSVCGG